LVLDPVRNQYLYILALTFIATAGVSIHSINRGGKRIHLIDTPGLDATDQTDLQILEQWAYWLIKAYDAGLRISGVIYVHNIANPRISGSGLLALNVFKAVCGSEFYSKMTMITTQWRRVESTPAGQQVADSKVAELMGTPEFWGTPMDAGAKIEPMYGNQVSALSILDRFLHMGQDRALQLQQEMSVDNRTLYETAAGKLLSAPWIEEKKELESQMVLVKSEQALYRDQISKLEQNIVQLRQDDKMNLVTVWDIKVTNSISRMENELEQSHREVTNLETMIRNWREDNDPKSKNSKKEKKEIEKMVKEYSKQYEALHKARSHAPDSYKIATMVAPVVGGLGAIGGAVLPFLIPAAACTIM
jgi:hypothetical protein